MPAAAGAGESASTVPDCATSTQSRRRNRKKHEQSLNFIEPPFLYSLGIGPVFGPRPIGSLLPSKTLLLAGHRFSKRRRRKTRSRGRDVHNLRLGRCSVAGVGLAAVVRGGVRVRERTADPAIGKRDRYARNHIAVLIGDRDH